MQLKVFISHKSEEKDLADTIREKMRGWGLPSDSFVQVSHYTNPLEPGAYLNESIREKIGECDLFLLIYSGSFSDLTWCAVEFGIAVNSPNTKIVVFEVTSDRFEPALGQISIQINANSISNFVQGVHNGSILNSIFDGELGEKLGGLISTDHEVILQRGEELYSALRENLPKKPETRNRWDYLKLHMEPIFVRKIQSFQSNDLTKNRDIVFDIIRKNTFVIKDEQMPINALPYFGFKVFEQNINLKRLKNRWIGDMILKSNNIDPNFGSKEASIAWVHDLYSDIFRAIKNMNPKRTFNHFESAEEDDKDRYRPAVIRAYVNADQSMDFDVYLYKVDPREANLAGT